jgi:molecular chaperone IbpA
MITPLFRTTIGFDRLPVLLTDAMERIETGYPPYNIEKCGENEYRIALAIAGFEKDEIEIVTEQNILLVRGRPMENNGHDYLYRGIAARSFERIFNLADFVEVSGAMMGNGLLIIDLKSELPEALKPRRIEIASAPLKLVPLPSQRVAACNENPRPM